MSTTSTAGQDTTSLFLTSSVAKADVRICDPGSEGGLLLPLFESENDGSKVGRAFVYGFLLFYCFLGVNTVADVFMSAIEAVTSAKRRVFNKATGRYTTIAVWNDTVKNLSLLALGSSAPEILLSIIEIMSNSFFSGELGPSTIVGSAAFNLFCIVAVCIIAIESPDVRKIKEQTVYNITAVFSLLAYFWLLLIVSVFSPDTITILEAMITLFMFPVLVGISYLADVGYFSSLLGRSLVAKKPEEKLKLRTETGESQPGGVENDVARKKASMMHARSRASMMTAKNVTQKATKACQEARRGSMLDDEFGRTVTENAAETLPAGNDGDGIREVGGERALIANPQGVITFCVDILEVQSSSKNHCLLVVPILRQNGSSGVVSCKCRTEKWSALPQYHYEEISQDLEFQDGVERQELTIKILPSLPKKRIDRFQIILDDVQGGAQFNPNDDGGEERAVLTVDLIPEDKPPPNWKDWFEIQCCMDRDVGNLGMKEWQQQIKDAISISPDDDGDGKTDGEGDEAPSTLDYVFHYVSLPWKLFYAATAPPPIFAGGWLLFWGALFHIGIITAIICDLAQLFGCCLGVGNAVTAITVVALGTSLPDLFASKAAACEDEYADASIVNVTGSNSVNVFLGIGFPWTIAAIYWKVKGEPNEEWLTKYAAKYLEEHPHGAFIVEAGSLGFSVTVFSCCALIAILTLRVKRLLYGGELGGPEKAKFGIGALFVSLWIFYLVLSILRDSSDAIETPGRTIAIVLAFLAIIVAALVELGVRTGSNETSEQSARMSQRTSAKKRSLDKVPLKIDVVGPAANGNGLATIVDVETPSEIYRDAQSSPQKMPQNLSPSTCGKSVEEDEQDDTEDKDDVEASLDSKIKREKNSSASGNSKGAEFADTQQKSIASCKSPKVRMKVKKVPRGNGRRLDRAEKSKDEESEELSKGETAKEDSPNEDTNSTQETDDTQRLKTRFSD